MATQVIKSVGATGRDYATWQLACAAIPLDLITADENWIFEFYNDAEFDFQFNAAYLSSGTGTPRTIVADATRTVTFRAKAGLGFADHANKLTSPLRYDQSKGVAVVVGQGLGSAGLFNDIPYCKIEGMQIRGVGGTTHLIWSTGLNAGINGCLIKNVEGGQWPIKLQNGGRFINSVLSITGSSSPWGGVMFAGPGSVIGCTVWCESTAQTRAFYNNAGAGTGITIKNCVASGVSSFLFDYNASTGGAMWAGGTYSNNASDTTIPVGTSNLENLTSTNQFVNIASAATLDLRPKAGNSLQAGVTDALLGGVDLLGTTRAGTPTIGAVEYVVASSATVTFTSTTADATFSGGVVASTSTATFAATTADAVFSGTVVGAPSGGSITTEPFKNNTGAVLPALTVPKLAAIRLSDMTLAASWTSQTTNGSGVIVLTSDGLTAATDYLLVTSSVDGLTVGVVKYTAA